MRLITLDQLRSKIGGRSRNAIFSDIKDGLLPSPIKFGTAPGAKNYWNEELVDLALRACAELPCQSTDDHVEGGSI